MIQDWCCILVLRRLFAISSCWIYRGVRGPSLFENAVPELSQVIGIVILPAGTKLVAVRLQLNGRQLF
jgi:hypothetical protein